MDILEQLKLYIESNLQEQRFGVTQERCYKEYSICNNIQEYIEENKNENLFQKILFEHIDKKNLKDSDIYKKVHIDRRLFSKIRSNKNYHPSKETVILLGLALELDEKEIENMLISASYYLPKNNLYDLIIRFCFKEKIYNLMKVNELLDHYHCKVFE